MISGVHHIGLAVSDMAAARQFYAAMLGEQTTSSSLLSAINVRIKLHPATDDTEPVPALNRPGIRHFCVQNFNCDTLAALVEANGGGLIAPPLDLGTGNQYAYARDPEGNILEIEGLPYAPPSQPTWVGHVALVTQSIDITMQFYAALLGVTASGPRQVGPSVAVDTMGGLTDVQLMGAWMQAGPIALELWQFDRPAFAGSLNRRHFAERGFSHLAFESDNPDLDAKRALALGASEVEPAIGFQPTPSARASRVVCGPDGVLIELVSMAHADQQIAALKDHGVVARVEAGR